MHRSLEQRDHKPERVFLSHVQQEQPGEKPHALNIADLAVVHRVGLENVIKGTLPGSMPLLKEHVRGEGAGDVAYYIELSGRRFVENQMLR